MPSRCERCPALPRSALPLLPVLASLDGQHSIVRTMGSTGRNTDRCRRRYSARLSRNIVRLSSRATPDHVLLDQSTGTRLGPEMSRTELRSRSPAYSTSSTCSTRNPHSTRAETRPSWLQLKNLKQAMLPSFRPNRTLCPSAFTEVISSSDAYHSDRRGKVEMRSTPSSAIEIRAKGQPVATTPNAVDTERRSPVNMCWVTTLIDCSCRQEYEHRSPTGLDG